MKIGVCGSLTGKNADGTEFELFPAAREAGFDYVEMPLAPVAALDVNEFRRLRAQVDRAGIPVEACNVMAPASLRLTGPDFDRSKIRAYLDLAFGRAATLGASVVVFGSAGARNVPAGFSTEQARLQLVEVLRLAEPILAQNDLTLCVEPLHSAESNIIRTAAEGAELVRAADREHVRLLVDYYHMAREQEDCAVIRSAADLICHAHFADPDGRVYPQAHKPSFEEFFGALKASGYPGRVSLEAGYENFAAQAPTALGILRELAA